MISIIGHLTYAADTTEDDAISYLQQVAHDCVYGSFGPFPRYWDDKWQRPPETWVEDPIVHARGGNTFDFELRLSEDVFPVEPAGLQHLIGVLAGDPFYLELPNSDRPKAEITEVVLPEAMRASAVQAFRGNRAHDISAVRAAFGLSAAQPLLAFSFKPRLGIRCSDLEQVTLDVLEAGFHIVELDTRNLLLDARGRDQLVSLSKKAADVRGHIARFSPNLSVPAACVVDFALEFMEAVPDPVVIKIDGGLDGLSSCQAVRKHTDSRHGVNTPTRNPIITCYPLLRHQLTGKVPPAFYVKALAMSGADIIYPGNRPSFGEPRPLGQAGTGRRINAVRWYYELMDQGWPMPTIAGGVYVGQLQVFYELLGARTAFFLGGAVALHKDGPQAGARLCVKVIKQAMERRSARTAAGPARPLDDALVREVEAAYIRAAGQAEWPFKYVSPAGALSDTPGLEPWLVGKV